MEGVRHDSEGDFGGVDVVAAGRVKADGPANVDVYATVGIPGAPWKPDRRLSAFPSNAERADDPKDFGDYEGMSAYGGSFWYCWADNSGAFSTNMTALDVVTRKSMFADFGPGAAPIGSKPTIGVPFASGVTPLGIGAPAADGMTSQGSQREARQSGVADDFLRTLATRYSDWGEGAPPSPNGQAGYPIDFLGRYRRVREIDFADGFLASDASYLEVFELS